ncbi:unnamed protein product [Callosobruchus maculatus]|uniref:Uncharacterized protein n=1 Tax=Callosobruchus maculatus TaxID=64391 RepID=A0A653CTT6_CALMS|nr:unnamed protein product [Callosobruchus maculatus]
MVNWPAIGFTILPNVGGLAGGLITRAAIEKWYDQLKKPNWRPPNWAFGPIWTSLYCGMGYASYLVWKEGDWHQEPVRTALAVYGINLVANWSWTPIFFGAKDIQLVSFLISAALRNREIFKAYKPVTKLAYKNIQVFQNLQKLNRIL